MVVVGEFLGMMFNNHSLPKRRDESFFPSHPTPHPTFPYHLTQQPILHYCPGYSQAQLIRLIIFIYNGVPEAFEIFRCHPSTTEEELRVFLKQVAKHPLQYLILNVNNLPFKLQEVRGCRGWIL